MFSLRKFSLVILSLFIPAQLIKARLITITRQNKRFIANSFNKKLNALKKGD
jgi:hypothetical protein